MRLINKKQVAPGVWNCEEKFPRFSQFEMGPCMKESESSPTLRSRMCLHPKLEDRMQEMFIAFNSKTYVRPSFHYLDESFHMIEGDGKYLFFGSDGQFTSSVRLGTYHSELPFYCRIPMGQSHSFILHSKQAMAHEIVGGPFSRANTVFPSWSMDYTSDLEKEQFRNQFILEPVSPLLACRFDRITNETYRAKSGIVILQKSDITYLKSECYKIARKRIYLYIHHDDQALLHEMVAVYTGFTYVRPSRHVGKDTSFHILEGEADFVFFDELGDVIDVVPLGPQSSDKNFFVRIPQGTFHTMIMRSDHIVIHEATPGPFHRQDKIWAPWAPMDTDKEAVIQYLQKLENQILEHEINC